MCIERSSVYLCWYFHCVAFCCSASMFNVHFFHCVHSTVFPLSTISNHFFLPFSCVVCCLHSCGSSSVIKRAGNWWSASVSFDWKFCAMTTIFIVHFSGLFVKRRGEGKYKRSNPATFSKSLTSSLRSCLHFAACNCNSLSANGNFVGFFFSSRAGFQQSNKTKALMYGIDKLKANQYFCCRHGTYETADIPQECYVFHFIFWEQLFFCVFLSDSCFEGGLRKIMGILRVSM